MLAGMELRHLRYFVAVAEEENVSRAAVKLRVSQPGVSRQIRDLEEEIGFSLFDRSAKSVRLTKAGRIFLDEARGVLQHAADSVNKARASLGVQDEIKVGYAPSGTVEILPGALRVFQGKFPRARVVLHDLSVEEMVPKLLQKEMHIALTVPPLKVPRELGMKELERYDICAAVGSRHALARSKFVSLEQMAGEPERLFATIGRKPRIGSEHDGVTSLLASVAAGNGFALVPSCVSGMAGPRIKLLKLQPALPPIPIVALWRKDSETEIVRAFVAAASPKPAK